jgi:hypothetical protein
MGPANPLLQLLKKRPTSAIVAIVGGPGIYLSLYTDAQRHIVC